jgi:hypothetical protein
MLGGQTVAVAIEFQLDAEPIKGSLRVAARPPTPFRGWLALTSLLQAAAHHHDDAHTYDEAQTSPHGPHHQEVTDHMQRNGSSLDLDRVASLRRCSCRGIAAGRRWPAQHIVRLISIL